MAKDNNVRDFFKDLADSIRFKLNETEDKRKIKPIDMANVIKTELTEDNCGRVASEMVDNTGEGCIIIQRIAMLDGQVRIGGSAFVSLPNLKEVTFAKTVTSIGEKAFNDCTNLSKVTFSDGILGVGVDAFNNTAWYKSLSDGCIYIGRALYKYKGVIPDDIGTNLTIKDDTYSLSPHAFSTQQGLKRITLNEGLYRIDYNTFSQCTNLSEVILPDSLVYINKSAFMGCAALSSMTLPPLISQIEGGLFENCSKLETLMFRGKISSIYALAFAGCKNVTLYDFSANSDVIPDIASDALDSVLNENCKILVPQGMVYAWKNANVWKNYSNHIVDSINNN